ncbi:MAG: serine hydrolase [Rhodothermales bacterium]|nr:serine hydrolase [Rhodothermales bacterium]MBO6781104.1 serine hydrolase [Rhodothermales bacterium]
MRLRPFLWLLCLLVLLPACSDSGVVDPLPDPEPEAPTYPGAEAAGLDGVRIARVVARADSGDFGEIRSLLISRDGNLIVEEYFRGITAEEARPIYSVTKSFASALIGIAIHAGHIGSLESTLPEYFPNYSVPSEAAGITLENLLTMRAGFEWDEWTVPYGGAANSATAISRSGDVVQYMLDLPITSDPGTRFTYSSGVSMLLSGVLQHATGATTEAYADATIFEAVSLGSPRWDESMPGMTNTGWGLHLTARQLMAFGQLFENRGWHNGEEVVPRSWVDLSTSQHTTTNNGLAYGFQWWRFRNGDSVVSSLNQNDVYFAWGYGGQFVFVVPHKDVVIVTTAGNFEQDSRVTFDMLEEEIFPALR